MITKSKFLSGLQCHKLLWQEVHSPKTMPERAATEMAIMEQGREVGLLAHGLYPGGTHIPYEIPFAEKISRTQDALVSQRPIYEASFAAEGLHVRVDLLVPGPDGTWDIVEVKSGTEVKDEYLPDIAFQRHVCELAGLDIGFCRVARINNEYVRDGDIDLSGLFVVEDVTDQVSALLSDVRAQTEQMRDCLAQTASPNISIGPHCRSPRDCPMTPLCWDFLPSHSVFELYRGGQKKWDLFSDGIEALADVPSTAPLNENQRIQVACAISGEPHVDAGEIRSFLASLNYPLLYLDFETIHPAIPLFDVTRPYQQVPFQFFLHIQESPGATPRHFGYLAS